MEEEYVKYEEALALQELGFDEYCMGACYYEYVYKKVPEMLLHTPDSCDSHSGVKAPLYQQAFRFLRNKYNLMPLVDRSYMNLYEFRVVEKGWGYTASTYEEAELACLKKLIEVAKKIKENDDLTSSDIVGY